MPKTKRRDRDDANDSEHNSDSEDSPDDFKLNVWHQQNHVYFYGNVKLKNYKLLVRIIEFLIKKYERHHFSHKLKMLKIEKERHVSKEEKQLKLNLLDLDKRNNDIYIHFNSRGGTANIGLQMYTYLTKVGKKMELHTINEVECFSSATLPFLAGKHRSAYPHADFMIHEISYAHAGPIQNHAAELENTLKTANDFNQIYLKHLNMTSTELSDMLKKPDVNFGVDKAKELGFLTC